MRTPRALMKTGLGLLGVSLLATLMLAAGEAQGEAVGLAFLGWVAQSALYVGAALVVAGAVLRVLRPEEARRSGEAPFGQTDYWGG